MDRKLEGMALSVSYYCVSGYRRTDVRVHFRNAFGRGRCPLDRRGKRCAGQEPHAPAQPGDRRVHRAFRGRDGKGRVQSVEHTAFGGLEQK